MARDYYEKYSAIYEKYSKVLKQLNPIPKFSSAFNFSNSRKNLFVVVHDKNGITLAPEVEERIKKFQSRWLFVCLDVNYPVEIKNLELS